MIGPRTATGSPRRENVKRYAYRPDFVLDSLANLCDEQTYSEAVSLLKESHAPLGAAI